MTTICLGYITMKPMMATMIFSPDGADEEDIDEFLKDIEVATETEQEKSDFEQENNSQEKHTLMEGEDMDLLPISFDMQKTIADIIAFNDIVKEEIAKPIDIISEEDSTFENKVMDLIEAVVWLNSSWRRSDAISEAAKELVVVRLLGFSSQTTAVYERALVELKRATDEEYNLLRKQIFG